MAGWEEDPKGEWVIVNGCVVTSQAERKTRKLIYRGLKEGKKVILTGCASRYGMGIPVFCEIPEKEEVVKFLTGSMPIKDYLSSFSNHTRAWVKVQEGCLGNCSYCVIPRVRGKFHSRDKESILEEVRVLSPKYRELVITGTHLGLYGKERGEKLSSLLQEILKVSLNSRIRLSSLEITEIDEDLLSLFHHPRLCPHLHIPLQSGDNRILRLMHRPYTAEEFLKKCEFIKKKIPRIAFTTDIMVGFPSEDEEAFQKTLRMIEEIGFLRVHVFPFSPRKGTEAINLSPQLDRKTILERAEIARQASRKVSLAVRKKSLGKLKEVLIEKVQGNRYFGYSEDYIWTGVEGKDLKLGHIYKVVITKVSEDNTIGEVIKNE